VLLARVVHFAEHAPSRDWNGVWAPPDT